MMEYSNPNDFWLHTLKDVYKDMDDNERIKVALIHAAIFIATVIAGIAVAAVINVCL